MCQATNQPLQLFHLQPADQPSCILKVIHA